MPVQVRSAMLRAGDKQLRVAFGPHQPQGAQCSVSSLIATPPLGRVVRGGWAWGLRSGHAQAYATLPGPLDLIIARPSRAEPRRGQRYEGCLHVKGVS